MKKLLLVLAGAVILGILSVNLFGSSEKEIAPSDTLLKSTNDSTNPFLNNINELDAGDSQENGEVDNVNLGENSELKPLPNVKKEDLAKPIPNATGKAVAEPIPNATGEYKVIDLLPEDEELEETNFSFGEKATPREGFERTEDEQNGINGGGI